MAKPLQLIYERPIEGWSFARVPTFAVFGILTAFYFLTMPANRTEAIDGASYALTAETVPVTVITDTRSILFHVVNRIAYLIANNLGIDFSTYTIICGLVALTGAGAVVLMARLLNRAYGLGPEASWAGGVLLGISYGFWRYAVEVEVYVPSIFLILATLNLLLGAEIKETASWPRVIPSAILAGLAVLYYQPNALPLFFAIPALLLQRQRLNWFLAYGLIGTAVVVLGYLITFSLSAGVQEPVTLRALLSFVTGRNSEFPTTPFTLRTLLSCPLLVAHQFVSTNWVLGIEPLSKILVDGYPARFLEPKIFAAENFRPFIFLGAVLMPLIAVQGIALFWQSIRCRQAWRPLDRRVIYVLAWIAIASVVNGYLDPTSSEVWIMVLPPIVMLVSIYIFEPCIKKHKGRFLVLLLLTILLHNYWAGMGIWKSGDGDYFALKTNWIRANAGPEDLALFGINSDERRTTLFLHYFGGVNVGVVDPDRNTKFLGGLATPQPLDTVLAEVRSRGGRVFVLESFFKSDPVALALHPERKGEFERAEAFAEQLRECFRIVNKGRLGKTLELTTCAQ